MTADESKRKEKAKKSELNKKLDEESKESFPASDPPAFMGSAAIARFPREHEGGARKMAKSKAGSRAGQPKQEKKPPRR
jgi:hypothetical protein